MSDPGDEFERCFQNVFCVQRWGMTLGSCMSVLAIAFIWLDCLQHDHLRSLVRRPVSLRETIAAFTAVAFSPAT